MNIRRSLEAPMRQIAANASQDGAEIVQSVRNKKSSNWAYNAATEPHEDMVAAGVIAPAEATHTALQNAASVASLLLTTYAFVGDMPEKE